MGAKMLPLYGPEWVCEHGKEVDFNGATVVAIVVFAAIAVVVLLSTAYECRQIWLGHLVNPLYSSFSLYRNVKSILHISPRSPINSDMIDCAHGLRGISMIWILAVHVHEALGQVPFDNNPAVHSYLDSFTSAILYTTGYLAVDTFLVLSGILVAMNLMRQLDAKGRLNPLMLYLHRYIRITGPFAALVLFTVSFATYMGEGPLWMIIGDMRDICMENWWSALLHVQNYVVPARMCLGWTWYLSVDMQLFILAPALIYPLWRYGERVLIVIASLAVLSMGSVFVTFIVKDYRYSYIDSSGDGLKYVLTYFPTHARMAVWLWGIIFGYYLYKTKTYGLSVPKWIWPVGWVICFTIFGLIAGANYKLQRPDFDQYPQVLDAIYESLHRSVFAVALMWVILACVSGKAGVINEFLSAPLWQPLSRLSFTMYLLHVLLFTMASVASSKTTAHFSMMDLFYRIWGAIGLAASVSLPWSAIFEVPFITLDKLLLRN
ncbi:nose resistant to fluoxetine protein 6-like [Ochlerotatus camptorhynchus]|uniref:nose resistant to fluoxetine protein 6-like n=1 Tax=Ochlerotatus camptorhynchus TaxID=644619 RepID=UPI0031DC7B18